MSAVKHSELIVDDGAITRAIEQAKQLEIQIESLRKKSVELAKANSAASSASAAGRSETAKTAKEVDKVAKEYAKYQQSLDSANITIQALRNSTREQNRIAKLEAKLASSAAGSYNALSAEYSLAKIRLNAMSEAQRETTEEGQALEAHAKALFERMKELQEATGKHTLSVGDYGKALRDLDNPISNAINGAIEFKDQLKLLARSPVFLLLSGLVATLGALFAAFQRTEKGAEANARIFGTIQGILSAVVNIADKVADVLYFAFNNPLEALKNFGAFLVSQIINRLEGLVDLAVNVGKTIGNVLTLNFEKAEEAAKEAGKAVRQIATGFDEQQFKRITSIIEQQTAAVQQQIAAFAQLEIQRRLVRKVNRDLERSLEGLITKEALLTATADDSTKSFKEREEAAAEAANVQEQIAAKQLQVAKNNLAVIDQEVKLRRANGEQVEDLLDQQLGAFQALREAERDFTLTVRDNEKQRAELRQDRLERDLDILIDGFDNIKTVNERLLKDDALTLDERRKIFEETVRLSDESFQKQIETIQEFTGANVDANDLIETSDAVLLNAKIRSLGLSEIIEGRLLEIIRDRRTANQDLTEAEQELNEARLKANAKEIADNEKRASVAVASAKKEIQELQKLELEKFNQQQAFDKSEFGLIERTEAEKTKFQLQQERDRLNKLLELNQKGREAIQAATAELNEEFPGVEIQIDFETELSDLETGTITNQVEAINNELNKIENPETGNLFDKLGFSLDKFKESFNKPFDPKAFKDSLKEAVGFAIGQFSELADKRKEIADQAVDDAQREVDAARTALQAEIEAERQGFANRRDSAQEELNEAKQREQEALREQEAAQKRQEQIQSIQQAGNLVTASAKIWATLGFPFAIPAIAVMWGSFIASKVRAKQLSKQFRKGGLEFLDYGGSHESGNDIFIGTDSNGSEMRAERGEAMAVINRKNTKRYRSILPEIVDSLNKGEFEQRFEFVGGRPSEQLSTVHVVSVPGPARTDTRIMETELTRIRKQGEARFFVDGRGRTVQQRKNLTVVYVE